MTEIHPHDQNFIQRITGYLPEDFKQKLLKQYHERLKRSSRREANLFLLSVEEQLQNSEIGALSQLVLNADEDDLKAMAEAAAQKCVEIWESTKNNELEIAYKQILAYIQRRNIKPSIIRETPNKADLLSLVRRSLNKSWWLSNLRRQQNRDIETVARILNFVRKNAEIYASDLNVKRRRLQQQRQSELLENLLATNEVGDSYLLSELKAKSVSDPYVRRSELLVRCRGFEDFAKSIGDISLFITMTCPAKYHRSYATSGDPVEKWHGSTAKHAQDYLSTTFARIRATLERENIRPYGFRITEPHHDGTPHWHLLLFMPKNSEVRLKEIFEQYCFEEDGDEDGADKHRLTIIPIDPNKGSATGYIVKYISKNIDGSHLDIGIYGENPVTGAERIKTWASVWGIRQFQQIGGPQVSIWRELRRVDLPKEADETLLAAHRAADQSQWDKYLSVMGGTDCSRKDRPIKLIYKAPINLLTGVLSENQYGELKAESIYGLEHGNVRINTRPHTWEISRAN